MNLLRLRYIVTSMVVLCAMLSSTLSVQAQVINQMTLTGTLHVLWGLWPDHDERMAFVLTESTGRTTRLAIADDLIVQAGGIDALNRQKVSVLVTQARVVQQPLTPVTVQKITVLSTRTRFQSRITGAKPWITVMCKFSDIATEPKNYAYFNGMYDDTYPGFNHYWKEQSYNLININGSSVAGTGWFTLPSPRSTYVVNGALNFGLISQDCAGAADSVVNFSNYIGINMMFNADLDGPAWGGGSTLTLDGVSGSWSTTWMPPWGYSDVAVLAHEMGHGFGLPHSSGQYGATYDNAWDVMSDPFWNCGASSSATYGCLGQHTNAYHKDKLGWISSSEKYIAAGSATIVIDDLAMASTTNYRMAQIALNKIGTRFYTVEVRKLTGYDVKLPGYALVIHQVDTTRDRPAQVIDSDGNGNTGDAGAMWTTGETFSDANIGLTVSVGAKTTNGYSVTISIPVPTPTLSPTTIPISTNAGRFVGWGQSAYGQITAPNTNADIVDISAGSYHTLVLRSNGMVSAWGYNGYGQTNVPATLTDVVAVSAGYHHSLALKADGTVVGWGLNDYGQATPPSGLTNVIAISAGYWHSLALQSDGTVIGWGFNGWGEGSAPEFASKAVVIGTGIQSSMAVLADGSVVAWGYPGGTNQLAVPSGLTNVVDIAIGNRHAVALHANGTVTTWGDNDYGQQDIPAGLTNVVEIDTRSDHTVARTASGSVVVWGKNTSNQANVPAGLTDVRGVAAGDNHTTVFRADVSTTETAVSATATPTSTPTHTATSTPTRTATSTPTHTATSTPTRTATSTPTHTATSTSTRTATSTPTHTATSTSTRTATRTWTRIATVTPIPLRPGAFAKLGPIKNAINRPLNTTLSWATSNFATSYEYCLSTTITCSVWKNVGTARSVVLTNLQRNRVYYWHVRAKNSVGLTFSNDGTWKFTTVR